MSYIADWRSDYIVVRCKPTMYFLYTDAKDSESAFPVTVERSPTGVWSAFLVDNRTGERYRELPVHSWREATMEERYYF